MRNILSRFRRPYIAGMAEQLMLLNSTGDGSTLSLDFTAMSSLDSRFNFSRATTTNSGSTTYINSSGYVTTATTNEPRFDYDPTTLTPRGLLIEGSATNLAFRSNALNSTSANEWSNANCLTPSLAPSINDPAGGTNTWKVIAASGSAIHSWRNGMGGSTMTSGTAYTISVWAKPAEYDRIIISDPGGGTSAATFVMIGSGTATAINNSGIGTCTSATMVPYPNGWWRCFATFTRIDGVSTNRQFGVAGYPSGASTNASGSTYNGDGTSGVYIYGWMMETGSGASSYIGTGASTATRAADIAVMTGTNFSSWFNASAGTIFVNYATTGLTGANGGVEFSVGTSSSSSNRIGIRNAYVDYYSGGGAAQAEMYPTVTTGNIKIGTSFEANRFRLVSNNGTLRTDNSGNVPIGLNALKLYSDGGSSQGLFVNGTISLIKFFPYRMEDADLSARTA